MSSIFNFVKLSELPSDARGTVITNEHLSFEQRKEIIRDAAGEAALLPHQEPVIAFIASKPICRPIGKMARYVIFNAEQVPFTKYGTDVFVQTDGGRIIWDNRVGYSKGRYL